MKKEMIKTMTAAMLIPAFAGVSTSAAKNVAVNKNNFPDKDFRKLVSKKYDKNHDKKLSPKEIKSVKKMGFFKNNFKNIKGISYFYNLDEVFIQDSNIKSADFGNLKKLRKIWAENNTLTSLNISKCPGLKEIRIVGGNLKKIDLSQNRKLKKLDLEGNCLTRIDLSGNKNLEEVNLGYNSLSYLDVRNNHVLNKLTVNKNILSSVTFGGNDKLTELDLDNNNLTSIDLSGAPNLLSLDLAENAIKSLDLSKTPKIGYLSVIGNELVEIDTTVLNNIDPDKVLAGHQRAYALSDENYRYVLADYPVNHIENLRLGDRYINSAAEPVLEYGIPLIDETKRFNTEEFFYTDGNKADTKGHFIDSTPIAWKKTDSDRKSVSLQWSEIKGAESYTVHRIDLAERTARKYTNITGNTFADTYVKSGSAYIYYIEGSNHSVSSKVAVTVK